MLIAASSQMWLPFVVIPEGNLHFSPIPKATSGGEPALVLHHQLFGVRHGAYLGNAAVVDDDLVGRTLKDDACGCAGMRHDTEALGGGQRPGSHSNRHLGVGIAVVAYLDGHQPACGFQALRR